MAGNNSEADEETPKQLPLSEGEVAVLESYLEQWDSMSGQERNVVWEDATTEARLKAPAMDAKLLRSRKTVYRKWLQNHGGKKKDAKAPINLGRKWTYRSVVESLRKKELLKKIEDETGVKPGKTEMMNHYTRYLAKMVNSLTEKEVEEVTEMAAEWNKQGVPPEVQANMAKRKSDDILWYVASEMFKKAGMQLFMLSAWKNEEGKLLVSSHDYNDEFGNGESFSKTCDWQVILPEWESYVSKQFDKEVEGDAVVKKGRKDNTYTLKIGDDGLPVLPDHTEMDSDMRKAIRSAVASPRNPVPWKEVILRQERAYPTTIPSYRTKASGAISDEPGGGHGTVGFLVQSTGELPGCHVQVLRLVEQIRQGSKPHVQMQKEAEPEDGRCYALGLVLLAKSYKDNRCCKRIKDQDTIPGSESTKVEADMGSRKDRRQWWLKSKGKDLSPQTKGSKAQCEVQRESAVRVPNTKGLSQRNWSSRCKTE
ncbi:hypothetical protein DFH29DRAFT_882731 [Suillus ampliporus]|nr:hypothetical protein DFH29DRAFT_882731 [Suillus ampliporus]